MKFLLTLVILFIDYLIIHFFGYVGGGLLGLGSLYLIGKVWESD